MYYILLLFDCNCSAIRPEALIQHYEYTPPSPGIKGHEAEPPEVMSIFPYKRITLNVKVSKLGEWFLMKLA